MMTTYGSGKTELSHAGGNDGPRHQANGLHGRRHVERQCLIDLVQSSDPPVKLDDLVSEVFHLLLGRGATVEIVKPVR